MTTLTSTSSWHPNNSRHLLVSLLVFALFASVVIFFKNESYLSISVILTLILCLGIRQYWVKNDGALLAVSASFLLAYMASYLLFSTPVGIITITTGFITLIGLTYYLLLAQTISLVEAGSLLFIAAASFIISLFLPSNLFNVALLATLPIMLATPAFTMKTPLKTPYMLHVMLTGLIGASAICLTAVLFI